MFPANSRERHRRSTNALQGALNQLFLVISGNNNGHYHRFGITEKKLFTLQHAAFQLIQGFALFRNFPRTSITGHTFHPWRFVSGSGLRMLLTTYSQSGHSPDKIIRASRYPETSVPRRAVDSGDSSDYAYIRNQNRCQSRSAAIRLNESTSPKEERPSAQDK
jgi:hypothetical protein